MRPVNNKRARGRNSGNRRPQGGGPNRNFESNGPDTKIRGTASQVYEKYCALARDAGANGDHVSAETYQQHAEHYYRIMAAQAEQRQQSRHNGHQPPAEAEDNRRRESRQEKQQQQPERVPTDPAEAEQPVVDVDPAPAAE